MLPEQLGQASIASVDESVGGKAGAHGEIGSLGDDGAGSDPGRDGQVAKATGASLWVHGQDGSGLKNTMN